MRKFVNTLIIRDPALTLVSHYKLNPEFTLVEADYESMLQTYEMVKWISDKGPAIVAGDDLIKDGYTVVKGYCEVTGIPFRPEALAWGAKFKRMEDLGDLAPGWCQKHWLSERPGAI